MRQVSQIRRVGELACEVAMEALSESALMLDE
jgi:hypothetical protein